MKCAKSAVPCKDCEKRGVCPIYTEYLIASNKPYSLYGWIARPIHPHGDEWIGGAVYDIEEEPI